MRIRCILHGVYQVAFFGTKSQETHIWNWTKCNGKSNESFNTHSCSSSYYPLLCVHIFFFLCVHFLLHFTRGFLLKSFMAYSYYTRKGDYFFWKKKSRKNGWINLDRFVLRNMTHFTCKWHNMMNVKMSLQNPLSSCSVTLLSMSL